MYKEGLNLWLIPYYKRRRVNKLIITVTLNPAIDKFIEIGKLKMGELNRIKEIVEIPGGKGINVARVLDQLGTPVLTMGLLGGDSGCKIKKFLKEKGITKDFTWTDFPTRQNIKVREIELNRKTEINELGQNTEEDFKRLKAALRGYLPETRILILAGSHPRGLPADAYNQLIELAREYEVKTILDTSERFLETGLKSAPFLIKPNLDEIESLLNKSLDSGQEINEAIDYLFEYDVKMVVISLENKGAVFADRSQRLMFEPPEIETEYNSVGAGDSMVAGLALQLKENDVNLRKIGSFATAVATGYVKLGQGQFDKLDQKIISNIKEEIKVREIYV